MLSGGKDTQGGVMKKLFACLLLILLVMPCAARAAESFSTLNLTGLSNLVAASKGKIVVLNFFATWCPPCRMEIPDLVAVRKEAAAKDVVIIGLSVDEDPDTLPPFLKKLKVDYPVFLAGEDLVQAFNISSIPHNVFYGPSGKVMLAGSGLMDKKTLLEIFGTLAGKK